MLKIDINSRAQVSYIQTDACCCCDSLSFEGFSRMVARTKSLSQSVLDAENTIGFPPVLKFINKGCDKMTLNDGISKGQVDQPQR